MWEIEAFGWDARGKFADERLRGLIRKYMDKGEDEK
jgi:hypothetical protein